MALAVVQSSFGINPHVVPGSITLGSTPTVGNLIVAFLGVNITTSSLAIDTTKWTLFDSVSDWANATTYQVGVYRYVQGGDTSALPAFCTSGVTYWTNAIYEVSGVSGNFDTDLLVSFGANDTGSNAAMRGLVAVANGSLALTCQAVYNTSSNPTVGGSWTLDFSNNNNTNYGAMGSASRSLSAGTVLDGQWNGATGGGIFPSRIVCILTTAQSTTPYPKHHFTTSRDAASATHPTTPTVPWTPKVGNLLVGYLFWSNGTVANPTLDTTNWTNFATLVKTTDYTLAFYRYLQSGDTATMANICTAGSATWGLSIIEMAGVSGVFATDHVSDKMIYQDNASPLTLPADTTTANNQIVITAYGEYGSTGTAVYSSPFMEGSITTNNVSYGYNAAGFDFFPTSGSTVQTVITPGVSSQPQGAIQSIFAGSPSASLPAPFPPGGTNMPFIGRA